MMIAASQNPLMLAVFLFLSLVSDFGRAESGCSNEAEKVFNEGAAFWFGLGVERDLEQACGFFEVAASMQCAAAMYSYANCLRMEVNGKSESSEVAKFLEAAARGGVDEAKVAIASLYLSTKDEEHYPKAFHYLVEYLTRYPNDNVANFNIANVYFAGNGVERDVGKALHHYEIAAKNGNELAMALLHVVYGEGLYGVDRSEELSREWRSVYESVADTTIRPIAMAVTKLYKEGWGLLER